MTAGVSAAGQSLQPAKRLIAFLTGPAAASVMKANGIDPQSRD